MPLSKHTLEFLVENRLHNSREWYHAHKADYRAYVHQPLLELAEALAPTIEAIDSQINVLPKSAVSRVYRDTRFTKDKSLYRDSMWLSWERRTGERDKLPGLFFDFSPDGWRYGCGYYSAPPAVMRALREAILANDKRFVAAQKSLEAAQCELEGEFYKRDRYPDAPAALKNWLNRKAFYAMHESRDFKLLFSPVLADLLAERLRALAPLYEFYLYAHHKSQEEQAINTQG